MSAEKGRVLLGVSGGIAAYKAAEIASTLTKLGHPVRVAMTANATKFIGALTFAALTGFPVTRDEDLFDPAQESTIGHIELARWAQVVVLAPATANLIAKAALGLGDDFLSTVLLASQAPLLIAPAMNPAMFTHPATQENLAKLQARGARVVGPGCGPTACGEEGRGRMAEPVEIVEATIDILAHKDLAGMKVLVSAGPTREHLDPVRYLSNPSTGRMGIEVARAARRRGAEVTLVLGPTQLAPPEGVRVIKVISAEEMAAAILAEAEDSHVVVKSAAVSDYRPDVCHPQKVKKGALPEEVCSLKGTMDILAELGRRKKDHILVGFAAETEEVLTHGRQKLERKNLDLLLANDVSACDAGFAAETNRAHLIFADGTTEELPLMPKLEMAHRLLDHVVRLAGARRKQP